MKCLNYRNFVTAHAFLNGWHIFTFFTVAPFLCTPLVILDFCSILVASNTVIWASLFGTHRFKLEVEDFIFHVVVFSRESFQTLAWKFLLCVPQKVFGVYIFPNFVLMQHIVVQKLVKARSSHQRCSLRKCILRNFGKFTGKHLCQSFYFNKVAGLTCNFIKIETLAQVFSCEFSKIFKNNFFTEYFWATASITHTQDEYILIVFFYFQVASNCANSSKQEVKHSHYNLSIKGEKYQLDLSKLLML